MRKLMVLSLALLLLVPASLAFTTAYSPLGVDAKYAGMGGAASAIVDDISCAYYNPAGIVAGNRADAKIALGAPTGDLNNLMNVIGQINNPAQFFVNNYNNSIVVNGNLSGIVGVHIANIGLSVIPRTSLNINKPAATIGASGTLSASLANDIAFTYGQKLSVPFLPASLNLGANIKYINDAGAGSTLLVLATPISNDYVINKSGFGLDLGAQTDVNLVIVPVRFGLVFRDLFATLSGPTTTTVTTYSATGQIVSQVKTEVASPAWTMPVTTTIGAATTIPLVGLKLALDLDNIAGYSYSGTNYTGGLLTHFGVEWPILPTLAIRAGSVAGSVSGTDISQNSLGLGFNAGAIINAAATFDNKNSKNNEVKLEIGFNF